MPRTLVGVMSGTSLDAIDIATVEISGEGDRIALRCVATGSRGFDPGMRERLHRASTGEMLLREGFELQADLGLLYADAIIDFIREHPTGNVIDGVGLHGQTVYHHPRRRPVGVTVQLNGAAIVAERLRVPVISDFRSADVAAGGEGAPLVPYSDYLLFRSPDRARIALNIGGIANITWLPPDAMLDTLTAFDTGPGNMMIDLATDRLFGMPYDKDGLLAASAAPDESWLQELMKDDYYGREHPKSAGREQFGIERTMRVLERARSLGLDNGTIIATLTALTAWSVVSGIRQAASGATIDEVIVGGGGLHNRTLMRMLGDALPGTRLRSTDDFGLPSDAKEAICFAILADAHLRGVPANVPSVTGASRRVILGTRW